MRRKYNLHLALDKKLFIMKANICNSEYNYENFLPRGHILSVKLREILFKEFNTLLEVSVFYAVRWMIWIPLSVWTGEDNSPTLRANAACSKGFCIAPRLNGPKSPPRLAELQSLYFEASSANVAFPDTICSL